MIKAAGPYIYEGKDRKITGFEFDLAEYLAKELGVRQRTCHIGMGDAAAEEARPAAASTYVLNGYEWSKRARAILVVHHSLLHLQLATHDAKRRTPSIRSWDDLRAQKGQPKKRIGVLRDSAAERYVDQQFGAAVELKGFPEIINVMKLVEEGRLDATVQDVPVSVFYGRDFPGLHTWVSRSRRGITWRSFAAATSGCARS